MARDGTAMARGGSDVPGIGSHQGGEVRAVSRVKDPFHCRVLFEMFGQGKRVGIELG